MVLSGVPLDKVITDADSLEDSWNALYSELHHWESLKTVEKGIGEDVLTNLSVFEERITSAQELYVMLKEDGVIFGPQTRPDHLKEWIEAIEKFREIASL
jgi:ASC-1-like (ASCH) protein